MKKFSILLFIILVGCATLTGLQTSNINDNLRQISSGMIINIVSLSPMDIPNPSQKKITTNGIFRVTQAVVSQSDGRILIPQNSLISGIYTNDGQVCQVIWQNIYINYAQMEQGNGTNIADGKVSRSLCSPKLGLRSGEAIAIKFK